MKTKIVLLLLMCSIGMAFGQENDIKKDGNYYFNYISLEDLKSLKSESATTKSKNIDSIREFVSGNKYKITVNNVKDDKVYFRFWKFDGLENNKIVNNAKTPNDNSKVIYVMSLQDFKENTKILYNRIDWRVGVYTIPFKLRLSSFNFDANVNLGANLGAKIRWNREVEGGLSFEPILGFGLASIKLDESNSKANGSNNTNVSAFTFNTGLLVHVTKSVNVGFTFGFDYLSKNDQNNYDWKYNGKGWLGIGINVAFSNQNDNTGNEGNNSGEK
ncbi:hypothetical protein EG349_15950 [Chryseobacterium shandongense]|uniref:DUF3575 domain-containing protein n=1 Tax=Chryseobacterium shandongense TaxID=1493872 RepID=A0A3G6R5C2_9FLAO|nr:hypothetical protein [Chryseobacterium shandongense]AZA56240.1 hypothetical protein EG350_03080 [Chryseobacterium shandongense]AZA88178.1 hypothetical protein EG349_15950 [Chryseobacterium shandongense]AZA96739.1 hypothetical protein EG353_14740 [Chryseobacterium shandongense]